MTTASATEPTRRYESSRGARDRTITAAAQTVEKISKAFNCHAQNMR